MNKLYILCGLPFSGKTTLANATVKKLGCERIDLDEIKFELYGKEIRDNDLKQSDWDLVYQKMYKAIEEGLKEGKTVIHDTGNFTNHERELVIQIAKNLGVETKIIFVDIPKDIAYKRILQNRASQLRFDVTDKDFENAAAELEIPTKNVIFFRYGDNVDSWIDKHIKNE